MAHARFNLGNWYFEFIEDWLDLFADCNWYDFNALQLYLENDKVFGNFEIKMALLGLQFRLTYHYADTDMQAELQRRVEEIENGDADATPFKLS